MNGTMKRDDDNMRVKGYPPTFSNMVCRCPNLVCKCRILHVQTAKAVKNVRQIIAFLSKLLHDSNKSRTFAATYLPRFP